MKRNFWTKLGLLGLACGISLAAPAAIINADDTTNATSTATLNLDSTDTHLSLDAVPSFPFGTVKTGDILSGKAISANLTKNNNVTVTDTRLDSSGWQLSVSSTAFTNTNGQKLISGNLSFTPDNFAFSDGNANGWTWAKSTELTLPSSSATPLASSTGVQEGTATAQISAASFKATSHDALASSTYTSKLNWNLATNPNPSASE